MESSWHLNVWSLGLNGEPFHLAARKLDETNTYVLGSDYTPSAFYAKAIFAGGNLGYTISAGYLKPRPDLNFPYGITVAADDHT